MKAAIKECPKVIVSRRINAERARVFDAWTKPELMQKWLFPGNGRAITSNDLRVGGKWSHEMIFDHADQECETAMKPGPDGLYHYPHHGEYLEITPPSRLVFTWFSPSVQNTRVTVELVAMGKETHVNITHELLATDQDRESHSQGWTGVLENLVNFVA